MAGNLGLIIYMQEREQWYNKINSYVEATGIQCSVYTKRVEWVVFQSFDIFSVMVHTIETTNIPT